MTHTTPTSGAADLASRLRNACASVRSKSYPLADLIPLMQQAADALASAPAQPVAEPAKQAVTHLEYKQFLSDVMTAAGLVTHGKRCKALGDRLADRTMRLCESHGQAPAGAAPECLTCSDHGAVGNILTAEPCPDCTRWNVQPAQARADSVLEDAAFEAVRKKLCALPRYSFVLDDDGLVRRVQDRSGNWIEFDDAHELFDPVAVDASRKQGEK